MCWILYIPLNDVCFRYFHQDKVGHYEVTKTALVILAQLATAADKEALGR